MPRLFIIDGSNSEGPITPTTLSGCGRDAAIGACSVTATFTNAHGNGAKIASGSAGLDEAINYAQQFGGMVVIDGTFGGTNATITGGFPYAQIPIEDQRTGLQYWNAAPVNTAYLAVPTALTAQAACDSTHTFCSDANVAGTWTSGTLFGCVSYVDVMGNEGPCSTTANFTTVASIYRKNKNPFRNEDVSTLLKIRNVPF